MTQTRKPVPVAPTFDIVGSPVATLQVPVLQGLCRQWVSATSHSSREQPNTEYSEHLREDCVTMCECIPSTNWHPEPLRQCVLCAPCRGEPLRPPQGVYFAIFISSLIRQEHSDCILGGLHVALPVNRLQQHKHS